MKMRAYAYDVWGNENEGYWVNDRYNTGEVYDVDLGLKDKDLIASLKRQGCITKGIHAKSVTIEGDEYGLYFEYKGRPDFELVPEDIDDGRMTAA